MSTTVGDRLKLLSGLSGATVGAMLFAIGGGATTVQSALIAHSGLATATVAEHLLVDVVVAAQQGGGVFKPRRAATTSSVSARSTASWSVVFPQPVVRIVVAASPQFTHSRIAVRWAAAKAPYIGLSTPGVASTVPSGRATKSPVAGAAAPFVSARGYLGGEVLFPAGGAVSCACYDAAFSFGLVLPPGTVKNLTPEMMMFL